MPRRVNHFRIGEALFLGTDLVNGGTLPGLRVDVVRLEGEVAEIKEKSLVPLGETGVATPFDHAEAVEDEPGQPVARGYRALITVGQLDTDVAGLTPLNPRHQIAGASSDITVVNLGEDPNGLRIGDTIGFSLSYSALVRIMNDPYITKVVHPGVDEFAADMPGRGDLDVSPVVREVAADERI